MNFDWDAGKAVSNLRKHGVAFVDAAMVFLDEGRIEIYDDRENYGEDRWIVVGRVSKLILCVVYTVRQDDTTRIISARKAVRYEQKQYRQTNH